MRYAHRHGLLPPDAVALMQRALAAQQAAYSAGPSYISATSLVGEPLPRQLKDRYADEIELDVLESTWALFGSAVHHVLESGERPGDLHERRFFAWFPTWPEELSACCQAETIPWPRNPNVPVDAHLAEQLACTKCKRVCSWVISGQADLFSEEGTLYDFKVTSAWAFRLEDGVKGEWEGQLNVLAHLIRNRHWYYEDPSKAHEPQSATLVRDGLEVKAARIFAFLRDFSPGQSEANTDECLAKHQEPDYPVAPMHVVEAPLWSEHSARAFIEQRLALHSAYDQADPTKIPECSPGMRWFKGDSWAVFKLRQDGGRPARATKVFREERGQTIAQATRFADELRNEGHQVEFETRLGESTKCAHYCAVRSVCPYGKSRAVENRIEDHARRRELAGCEVKRWPTS